MVGDNWQHLAHTHKTENEKTLKRAFLCLRAGGEKGLSSLMLRRQTRMLLFGEQQRLNALRSGFRRMKAKRGLDVHLKGGRAEGLASAQGRIHLRGRQGGE